MSILEQMKPELLGGRLRAARLSARVTQETAAAELGVARTTIVAIEGGGRRVKAEELRKLAELYGVSVNSLLRDSAVSVDLVPQFRKAAASKNDEELSVGAARVLQRLAGAAVEVENILHVAPPKLRAPEHLLDKPRWAEQAEDVALDLRQRLGIGVSPIADIFVLTEVELGIRLFFHRLPSKIAGLCAFDLSVGACILINSVHPLERQVWTCAHEIAHVLTRETAEVSWQRQHEKSISERFADRFAAAFLMPAPTVRLRFSDIQAEFGKFTVKNLYLLARMFNVSVEAMGRRLEQLSLIPAGTYDSLKDRGFSVRAVSEALGIREVDESTRYPARLALLVWQAYENDLLTEGQVCDLLDVDRVSVRKMFDSMEGRGGLGEADVKG
jgi:Zn-dependent peptidase ImmA (M78 family)/plasmid maintenance system antidote protein VapI